MKSDYQHDSAESESRRLLAELEQLEREQKTLDLRDRRVIEDYQRRVQSLRSKIHGRARLPQRRSG